MNKDLAKICSNREITKTYSNGEITIIWKPSLCTGAGVCWGMLPAVYRPRERPWIHPECATTAQLIEQIDLCPSGALTYRRDK